METIFFDITEYFQILVFEIEGLLLMLFGTQLSFN